MMRLILRVAGILETVSLLGLLINLLLVHQAAFAAALGPVHGIIYVAVVILSLLIPIPFKHRLLGLIPGIGGLLVVRAARRDGATESSSEYW